MKPITYGFGVDPTQSINHFYVLYQTKDNTLKAPTIQIFERFTWTDAEEQNIDPADKLRLELSKHKWDMVKDALTAEFNTRLKKDGFQTGKFISDGGTPVERLFGKEMMVLLWAIEHCDPRMIPTALRNWSGLLPEERWWLYTMTNAATGDIYDKKGWRKALFYALCENPLQQQITIFNMED